MSIEGIDYPNSVETHHIPASVNPEEYDELWYPIIKFQVSNLLGQILTQVDSMNLPPETCKANKDIYKGIVWRWFDSVMDNSATSSPKSGIQPIKCRSSLTSPDIH